MDAGKRYVYVLRNAAARSRLYVGLTSDVRGTLDDHNAGRYPHTERHRPWQLHVVVVFPDEGKAVRFERFLKSGPGRDFAQSHFDG